MSSEFPSGARILLEKALPNVPRETWKALLRYGSLTMTWNPSINLTGAKDLSVFLQNQVLDCALAYQALPATSGYLDLGSGAGLPGLVWSILDPTRKMILVEVLKKRSAFLHRVVGELKLANVSVLHRPFQELQPNQLPADYSLVSRGTWPPQELLQLAATTSLPWETWWIFSNEKLHQEYLKLSPTYKIRAQSLHYPKYQGEKGLLTRLDRRG
ncbi:MAG TPA: RsmG family class I SAM-dependent methyltransferase [bacterium]|nr:RsmG family class I SAM-dependent methyltransferase [bacterium]